MSYGKPRAPRYDHDPLAHEPSPYPQYNRAPEATTSLLSQQRKADLKNKIKEIIGLCKDENLSVTRDIAGVAEAEKGILNMLEHASLAAGEPSLPSEPHYPPTHTNIAPSSNFTPVRGHLDEAGDPGKAMQQDIRNILASKGNVQLTQQALQLINEIERRCLAEIEKMRDEKLGLISQLNEEIKQHNATNRRNAELEKHLEQVGRGGAQVGQQELRNRVAYLENLLSQVQQEGTRSENPDFKSLYAQGEAIRQETLRLLKMRESRGQGQDPQKRQLREENEALMRRVEFLEQERPGRVNKPSYEVIQEEYSPISQSNKRNSYRNSANEYESLMMEMRKITNN